MPKIKQIIITFQVFIFAFLSIFLVLATGSYNKASAAEPGCYQELDDGTFEQLPIQSCPGEGYSRAVSEFGACFVGTEERNCDELTQAGNQVPDNNANTGSVKVDLDGEGVELSGTHFCGKGTKRVRVSFDIGCLGESYKGEHYNPVIDMLFALLRFVSAGVGLVVIGSIIWAGIQYSASRGNPQSTEAAVKRVANSVIALLIYIFAFAILNFLVPGGLFV